MNLESNLSIIDKLKPELSKKIRESVKPDWCNITQNQNLAFKDRASLKLNYNKDDPKKFDKTILQTIKPYKEFITVIIGIGLGYFLNELLKKKEKGHKIVIIEPKLYFLKKTFENYDLSEYIKDGTIIIPECTKDGISQTLAYIESLFIIENWSLHVELYAQLRKDEYNELITHTINSINSILCNVGTMFSASMQIALNDIENLPYVIKPRGVAEIKNLFKKKPAILVSTGPSLSKNVYMLQDIQNKVIIISVAQALRPLLAYNIRPDFITTVDYGKINEEHFTGLYDSNIPLVFLNRTYKGIIKKWQGPKFIVVSPNPTLKDTSVDIIKHKGTLEQGGSVSHMNLALACHLGCNPIILIGQDLALSDLSHIPLADATGKIEITKNGTIDWKTDDPISHLGQKTYSMGPVVTIRGYFGDIVITNTGLSSFINAFEAMVRQNPGFNYINCTEGGAHIEGFKEKPLDKIIEKYCIKKIDKSILKKFDSDAEDANELIEKVIPMLSDDIKTLNKIIRLSKKGLKADDFILENITNQFKILKGLQENEDASNEACRLSKTIPLVGLGIYTANRQIQGREFNMQSDFEKFVNRALEAKANQDLRKEEYYKNKATNVLLKNKKYLRKRIERNRKILNAAKDTSEKLIKIYRKTSEILKQYHEIKDESLLIEVDDYVPDLSKVDEFFDKGNWGRPLLDFRPMMIPENKKIIKIVHKASKMRDEAIQKAKDGRKEIKENFKKLKFNNLIKQSIKIGKETEDFQKSLELIQRALKLYPDNEFALYGLATTYHHIGQYEESLKGYEKLIELKSDNNRYKFEMGQVMLIIPDKFSDGMKLIGECMEKDENLHWFYKRIGQIYQEMGMKEKADIAFSEYLKKFPYDEEVNKIIQL